MNLVKAKVSVIFQEITKQILEKNCRIFIIQFTSGDKAAKREYQLNVTGDEAGVSCGRGDRKSVVST